MYSPPFDDGVYARSAPELTGPWSAPARWYTAPDPDPPYDVVRHAELDAGSTVYLSYTRATGGWFGRETVLVRVELQ